MVTPAIRVEVHHPEIPCAISAQDEAAWKRHFVPVHHNLAGEMATLTQLVSHRPQEVLVVSAVGLMTALATDPVDGAVRHLTCRSKLLFVTRRAHAAARRPQQLGLIRRMR